MTAAGLALLVRLTTIAQPLGIDQSLWASAVRGMARGQLLYRDVWEQRPPGIYWIYLAGFRLFGWEASTVAWLDIIASAATTLLLFATVRRLADRSTGLLAAALYQALTLPAWLYGHSGFLERSVCETFIVPCVAGAALCAARFLERPSPWAAASIGLLCGAAVVLKPNAGLYCPALLLWMFLYTRTAAIRPLAMAALGGAILPAVALIWLASLGLLADAKTAVIDFNRYYVGEGFSPASYAVDFSKAVWLRIKTDPLWLGGAAGSIVAVGDLLRRRTLPPLPALAVIWGAAAALVIVVNGSRLFNSYFINAFAPLAIMAAWLLGVASRESRSRRWIAVVTGVLMALLMLYRGYVPRVYTWARADVDSLRHAVDRHAYLERFGGYDNQRGYSARANTEVAEFVRQHTAPEDRIFLFGINGAGIYFASDRLTAHPFLRVNFFVGTDFPDPRFRLDAVLAELARSRPRYIIFERLNARSDMGREADRLPQHPSVMKLLAGYRLETQIEDFTLYRRVE